MKRMQAGFTMIELIVVIVILGVLAATALPKFVDIRSDADTAAIAGVAGAMGSAMSINYGGCLVTGNVVTANKCVKIRACSEVANILQGGAVPAGYTVGPSTVGVEPSAIGTVAACKVTPPATSSAAPATFDGIGAGT